MLRLLGDAQLRGHLADGGRRLAETVYDWQVVTDSFEHLLTGLVR